MVARSLKKTGEAISDSIRKKFSTKKWENKEQLQSITETNKFFLKKVRWQIAILAHVGFAISFGIRANFGVSKTRMTSNFTDAFGAVHEQKFFWTPTELGMMESSFFYGYAASQIPAGILAAKFSPNKLFCLGVFLASILNIIIGYGFYYHPLSDYAVMILQVLQGIALGVIYPAMHGVWRLWAPPMERSKLATTTFTGGYVGVMLGLSISASLVSYLHWSAPFFAFGVAGILWSAIWFILTSKSPADHPYISQEEKTYILEKVGTVVQQNMTVGFRSFRGLKKAATLILMNQLTTVPWKAILLSLPMWAISIANFCRSWTFFLLLNNQLSYMKDVLHMDIRNSGLVSMLPHFVMASCVLISGQLADYLRSSGKMDTQNVRKLFNTLGFGFEAFFLCLLAFITDPTLAIFCLVIAAGGSGTSLAGFNVNHFDIAPRYAPILMGLSNGFGALAGLAGYLTQNLTVDNPAGWKWCFLIAVGVDIFGIAFYLIFGKGVIQDWAREPEPEATLGEFVRKISTMVRKMSSRKGSLAARKTLATDDGPDYARMEGDKVPQPPSVAPIPTISQVAETSFSSSEEDLRTNSSTCSGPDV